MKKVGLFVSLVVFSSALFAAPSSDLKLGDFQRWCLEKLSALNVHNENVVVPVEQYKNTAMRNLKRLFLELSADFKITISRLPARSRIFDSGGGLSVYGLELAKQGHEVTTVSTHDFYDAIYRLTDPSRAAQYVQFMKGFDSTLDGVDRAGLANLVEALDIELPKSLVVELGFLELAPGASPQEAAADLVTVVTTIQSRVHSLQEEKKFVPIVDLVQNTLSKIPDNSQTEVIDVFGAFYYSSDRIQLLQQFSRILEPGRKAHIAMVIPPPDLVIVGEEEIELGDYLKKTYPKHSKKNEGWSDHSNDDQNKSAGLISPSY